MSGANDAAISHLVAKFKGLSQDVAAGRHDALLLAVNAARVSFEATPGAPHTIMGKPVVVKGKVVGDTGYVGWPARAKLVNNPTRPHMIVSKSFGGTRKKRTQAATLLSAFGISGSGTGAVNIPSIGPRAWAHHPGTHGKHFFERAVPVATRVAADVYARWFKFEALKHFRGG